MTEQGYYGSMTSTDGMHQCVTTTWLPPTTPRGVVQIVHGMREHMGRYDDFATFLASQGFVVCGHDQLGHGKTVENGDLFGYFGAYQGAKYLVQDSAKLTRYLSHEYPDLPLFLLGHSMGSFVSRLQILQISSHLTGYICMGTAGKIKLAPYGRAILERMIQKKGGTAHSSKVDEMVAKMFGKNLRKWEPADAWISHDAETVRAYEADPFTRPQFTLQGYADLLDMQMACNRLQWYDRVPTTLPMLLVSGAEDPVSRNGKDIPEIFQSLTWAQVEDASYSLYEGMRHEILNEVNREKVYMDLVDWMERKITK